ncbi:hypothetical protein GCM10009625_37270 [Brachybacterium fresconis]
MRERGPAREPGAVDEPGGPVTSNVRPADVPAAQAALDRYQSAREDLEAQATQGVEALRARRRRR